ncbi:MAG: flavin reductase [Planctomycetaceae bacterium]|nr:flavin reductase [Planctomycetaceae bacterium]
METKPEDQVAELLRQLNPEIWLVTAATAAGRRGGLIATGVMSASIVAELPRVLVGIACRHATAGLIGEAGCFALHLLRPEQTDLVHRFGLMSGRTIDKLDGIPHQPGTTGSPIVAGCRGWLECQVETALDGGDRTFYLAQVVNGQLAGVTSGQSVAEPTVLEQVATADSADSPPASSRTDDGILRLQTLLAALPDETRAEMRRQREADAESDARAIRSWRASHTRDA